LNKKTRKERQIKFCKAMSVLTLAYGSEIWTEKKKKNRKQKLKTAKMKILRGVAGHTRKDQIIDAKRASLI
jgi:hypothetical protein